MKVVYNGCFGGFGLSDQGEFLYKEKAGEDFDYYEVERHNPHLIAVVEELGEDADGFCAALRIKEIPDGASYEIHDYDGNESVVPPRQSW